MPKTSITDPSTTEVTAPTPAETIKDFLGGQRRRGAPIRNAFLQKQEGEFDPGPLRLFVNGRRHFALNMYLLAHQLALGDPWDVPRLPAEAIARALGKTNAGAESTISRNWRWLEKNRLLQLDRDGQLVKVTLLKEDGEGDKYEQSKGRFFVLPRAYFLEGHHENLSLSATAALLMALKASFLNEWFALPPDQAARWYGVSADTIWRGLRELAGAGLLESRLIPKQNARARGGVVRVNEYRLLGSFKREPRKQRRTTAAKKATSAKVRAATKKRGGGRARPS